jgi:regulator of replication initiation timing
MDHASIAQSIIGIAGLGIGYVTHALIYSGKTGRMREIMEAQKAMIVQRDQDLSDATGELEQVGDRNSALRLENKDLREQLSRADAENNRLRPHADAHLASVRQRETALAKAKEANRQRHAAKQAGNVTPIAKPTRVTAPKKPTRKSALAG